MAIVERTADGVCIFQIEGVVGVGGEEALHERVQQRVAAGTRLFVFNMDHVTHVDSTGIAALIGAYATIMRSRGRLILARLHPHVTRVLTVTKLLTVLESADGEDDAVARLR